MLTGARGAVLQSKRRTVTPGDADGERKWLQKNATKALKQAKGTVRQLRLCSAQMTNGRGRTLNVDRGHTRSEGRSRPWGGSAWAVAHAGTLDPLV